MSGQLATIDSDKMQAELLAASDLLPKQYRAKPANVLWAITYGRSLDMDPVTAMLAIHVIDGQPTLSAHAQAALVRRAGHRVRITGNDTAATATIIRADDPDYEHTATWTMERAHQAGLAGRGPWKQYPAAMLAARATTEVIRMAASEVLLGATYTAEEIAPDAVDTITGEIVG